MGFIRNKRLFYLFLSFIFIIYTFSVSLEKVEASEVPNYQVASSVGIIDSDRPLTEFETEKLLQDLNDSNPNIYRATGVSLTYYLVRSGNTTSCELIAKFNATGRITNLWWESLTVQSPSAINRKTYKTFNKVLRGTGSKTKGTVSIGSLSVPKGIKSAYLKTSGTQASSNNDGWGSLINFYGSISMN